MPIATSNSYTCPLCGNKVPEGLDKCPVCSTPIKAAVGAKATPREGVQISHDYLRKGLPQTSLSSTGMKCPLCAKELDGRESKCPRCGIPLVSKAEMLECPECGALAPEGSKSCPSCGIGFEEEVPPPPPRPAPPPVPIPIKEERPPVAPPPPAKPPPEPALVVAQKPPAPRVSEPPSRPAVVAEKPLEVRPKLPEPPARKAPHPEVVTVASQVGHAPKTEGFTNGRSSPSPGGFVNGTGLVNGTGMTNGTRLESAEAVSPRHKAGLPIRWQFLAVLVAVIVVVSTFVFLSFSGEKGPVTIDGKFGDWSETQKFTAYTSSTSSTVNINEWAVQTDDVQVYLYVEVEGAVMWSPKVSSLYLFIDSDSSATTGYEIAGIGADYLVELDGWDGEVGATAVYQYGSAADHFDWSKWLYLSGARAAVSNDRLEAVATLPIALGDGAKYLLVSQDEDTHLSASYPVPHTGGILVIRQEPGPGISVAGTVPVSSSIAFLKLSLTCDGTGGTIGSISPSVSGADEGSSVSAISIAVGEEKVAIVSVDTSSSVPGSTVSAYVQKTGVASNFDDILVIGSPVKAYVGAPPSTIEIDGAFGDWAGRTTADGDGYPLADPNTDIDRVGAVNETAQSFFYVSVMGDICSGTYVPVIAAKPTGGGGGGGTVVPRRGGEDILRIYVDSDLSTGTGFPISASTKTIGADFRIEVKGMFGAIVSESVSYYSGSSWLAVQGADISAANDLNELELRVSAASISGAYSLDFIVETTDWHSWKDVATAVPVGTRAATVMASGMSPESWVIDGGTNAQATAMSYQRKLFYDGTNFWSFYWDGTNTVYKYSTDNGMTWTVSGSAFKTVGVNEVSIWYDSASISVYAVGDISAASRNVYLQKGSVSPATHVITWQAADSTATASAENLGGKNAFIALDSQGYVWILSSNLSTITPSRYDLTAMRSSSAGNISNLARSGGMIVAPPNNEPNVKGIILPAGSGSNVWTVYMYGGSVYSRKYTGTWSAQSTIYANADIPQNQDLAPMSGVIDGNGVIHVVYGNGNQQPAGTAKPRIFYVYNTGASWSVPYRLDNAPIPDANYYPTISLDTSTNSVYAFWVYYDGPRASYSIVGTKNVSGTWTSLTLPGQTTDAKQYLTSIYSAPSENYICWQWTQNTTAPIQLHFDKIPEFPGILLPVLFVVAICIASRGLHRKRR